MRCSSCKQDKKYTQFHRSRKNKSGLQGWCRDCANGYTAQRAHERQASELLRKSELFQKLAQQYRAAYESLAALGDVK